VTHHLWLVMSHFTQKTADFGQKAAFLTKCHSQPGSLRSENGGRCYREQIPLALPAMSMKVFGFTN
jgi:hypothetical protein